MFCHGDAAVLEVPPAVINMYDQCPTVCSVILCKLAVACLNAVLLPCNLYSRCLMFNPNYIVCSIFSVCFSAFLWSRAATIVFWLWFFLYFFYFFLS
jgi:hypothetical protein